MKVWGFLISTGGREKKTTRQRVTSFTRERHFLFKRQEKNDYHLATRKDNPHPAMLFPVRREMVIIIWISPERVYVENVCSESMWWVWKLAFSFFLFGIFVVHADDGVLWFYGKEWRRRETRNGRSMMISIALLHAFTDHDDRLTQGSSSLDWRGWNVSLSFSFSPFTYHLIQMISEEESERGKE